MVGVYQSYGTPTDDDELNEGWLTREDAALKRHLQGIRVPVSVDDRTADAGPAQDRDRDDGPLVPNSKTRLVPVYFRLPENEVRRRTFPYITIDFLGAVRDSEREHRGYTTYDPAEGWAPPGTPEGGGIVELPIPMQLRYQVTHWARYARHDRILMTAMSTQRLEPRFGALELTSADDATDDMRLARLDLLGGPTPGDTRDEEGKRLFRKMYEVGISSELFQSDMAALTAAGRLVLDASEMG